MMVNERLYAQNFWGQGDEGVDRLLTRVSHGKQTCEDLKNMLLQRALLEDDYGKRLMKIAKQPLGKNDSGTLLQALEQTQKELETTAQAHVDLAADIKRVLEVPLTEFMDNQRDRRRGARITVDKVRRNKNLTMSYVAKAKEKYEVEIAKYGNIRAQMVPAEPKEAERFRTNLSRTETTLDNLDSEYKAAVETLQDVTKQWNYEGSTACDMFQLLDEERIDYTRDCLWNFTNLLSSVCVIDDEACEKIRVRLEACDVDKDIAEFVASSGSGKDLPEFLVYEDLRANPSRQHSRTHNGTSKATSQGPTSSRRNSVASLMEAMYGTASDVNNAVTKNPSIGDRLSNFVKARELSNNAKNEHVGARINYTEPKSEILSGQPRQSMEKSPRLQDVFAVSEPVYPEQNSQIKAIINDDDGKSDSSGLLRDPRSQVIVQIGDNGIAIDNKSLQLKTKQLDMNRQQETEAGVRREDIVLPRLGSEQDEMDLLKDFITALESNKLEPTQLKSLFERDDGKDAGSIPTQPPRASPVRRLIKNDISNAVRTGPNATLSAERARTPIPNGFNGEANQTDRSQGLLGVSVQSPPLKSPKPRSMTLSDVGSQHSFPLSVPPIPNTSSSQRSRSVPALSPTMQRKSMPNSRTPDGNRPSSPNAQILGISLDADGRVVSDTRGRPMNRRSSVPIIGDHYQYQQQLMYSTSPDQGNMYAVDMHAFASPPAMKSYQFSNAMSPPMQPQSPPPNFGPYSMAAQSVPNLNNFRAHPPTYSHSQFQQQQTFSPPMMYSQTNTSLADMHPLPPAMSPLPGKQMSQMPLQSAPSYQQMPTFTTAVINQRKFEQADARQKGLLGPWLSVTHSNDGKPVLTWARAKYAYTVQQDGEMGFYPNELFAIYHKLADGWWYGEKWDQYRNEGKGAFGLVPSNYLWAMDI